MKEIDYYKKVLNELDKYESFYYKCPSCNKNVDITRVIKMHASEISFRIYYFNEHNDFYTCNEEGLLFTLYKCHHCEHPVIIRTCDFNNFNKRYANNRISFNKLFISTDFTIKGVKKQ